MPKHIEKKDKADNVTKILGDEFIESKQRLYSFTLNRLLIGRTTEPKVWYKSQMGNLRQFSLQVNKMISQEKKIVLKATYKGAKGLNLDSKQRKQLLKEVNDGYKLLFNNIVSNYKRDVASIYYQAQSNVKRIDVVKPLYEAIKDRVVNNKAKYNIVYSDGKEVSWENYMEMKLRTDIQLDISKNLVKEGRNAGVIFYVCTFYGDCALDHADFQGKIYIDEAWESIIDKSMHDEVDAYIKANKILTIQGVANGEPYLTTRPNCRHFFEPMGTEEVIAIKSEKELDKKRSELGLNFNGKYKPEKYEALTKQRYNERQIRNWKGRMQDEQALLDKMPKGATPQQRARQEARVKIASTKVRAWQKEQNSLVKANPFLQRNYDREAYGKMISDFRLSKRTK